MKIINTLSFPTHALKRMTVWTARRLESNTKCLRLVRFSRSSREWGGLCHGRTRIGVRLGRDNPYPLKHSRFGREHVWVDDWEVLVAITAHELAHAVDYQESNRTNERSADMQMSDVLELFRQDRESLLALWLAPPKECLKPTVVGVVDRRALKAARMMEMWQRKSKIAANKLRKYKQLVAYYERRKAAKSL